MRDLVAEEDMLHVIGCNISVFKTCLSTTYFHSIFMSRMWT